MPDILTIPANSLAYLMARRDSVDDKFDVLKFVYGFEAVVAILVDIWGYWKCEEASSPRIDSTGHGHSLNPESGYNDPGADTGLVGDAISFPADQSYNLINEDTEFLDANQPYTVAFWFKVTPSENYAGLLNLEVGYMAIGMYENPIGSVWLGLYNHDDSDDWTLSSFDFDSWHFMCVYCDGSSTYIEVDNSPIGSLPSSDISYIEVRMNPGDYPPSAPKIDEFGIWKRMLSSDERTYLYNSGAGRTLY